jgi:hypothetical protein
MSLGQDEINRMMDETVAGWGINVSLYCATCGYNLRGLPYSGVCPECGHRYNARDHRLTGIFLPRGLEFPASDVFWALICIATTAGLVAWGFRTREMFFFAAIFGVLTVFWVRFAVRRITQYIHGRRILWRIDHEDD